MDLHVTAAVTDTGSGARRHIGTNPTEQPHVQGAIRSRRPYLVDDDLHRRGVSDTAISMPDSSFMYPYNPMLDADSAAGSGLNPGIEPSDSMSRRRPSQQLSASRMDHLSGLPAADAEDETLIPNLTPAGGPRPDRSDQEISRGEESRRPQHAGGRGDQAANPMVEALQHDMDSTQAAIAENFRQRYRMMAVQVGREGRADQGALVLRELDMDDEMENGPASFRDLARAYADANARRLWTLEERERIRDEALVVVELERRRQVSATVAMAGLTERDREATAGLHRRRLYGWADEEGVDADRHDHDEERSRFDGMNEHEYENENENENDTDGDENEDGWRDLEEALSSQYRLRNARNFEFERAEANRQRAQADMSRWLTERAARRREERIAALVDGSQARNSRRRHRANMERILRAMEGFMARERRSASGSGGVREGSEEREAEATRREVERRQDAQLRRSELVAEMLREREARRFAGANANTNTRTKTRDMLEYLSRLRSCDPSHPDEAIKLAISLGVDAYSDPHYDLLTSTSSIPLPAYSSLLTPGMTFAGSQHAPHRESAVQILSRDRDYLRRMVATRNRNRNQSEAHLPLPMSLRVPGSIATLADAEGFLRGPGGGNATSSRAFRERELEQDQAQLQLRARLDSTASTRPSPSFATPRRTHTRAPDHWPVSVTLHSVDLERLSLTGTMSANHIPDKSSTGSAEHKLDTDTDLEGSSMRSFFDGEIIDFRNVTLETETYKHEGVAVDLDIDARYWGQIGPFREMSEAGNGDGDGDGHARLASAMGRKSWLEGLMTEWVLMRWKERLFLPAASTSSSSASNDPGRTSAPNASANHNTWGLTISGFYYVAMKRDTGTLEGLYYDPASQPYQRLELRPERGGGWTGEAGVRKWFPSVDFGPL